MESNNLEYVNRREALFRHARNVIRADPAGFREAGKKIEEIFPEIRPVDPQDRERYAEARVVPRGDPNYETYLKYEKFEDTGSELRVVKHALVRRIKDAVRAALYPSFHRSGGWGYFDITGNMEHAARLIHTRVWVIAIMLGADPKAHEVITPDICVFGELKWVVDDSFDCRLAAHEWSNREWADHSSPPPEVLDLLEYALSVLDPTGAATALIAANTIQIDRDERFLRNDVPKAKPGGYSAMELRIEAGEAIDSSNSLGQTTFADIRRVARIEGVAHDHSRKFGWKQVRELADAAECGGELRGKHRNFRHGKLIAAAWRALIPAK